MNSFGVSVFLGAWSATGSRTRNMTPPSPPGVLPSPLTAAPPDPPLAPPCPLLPSTAPTTVAPPTPLLPSGAPPPGPPAPSFDEQLTPANPMRVAHPTDRDATFISPPKEDRSEKRITRRSPRRRMDPWRQANFLTADCDGCLTTAQIPIGARSSCKYPETSLSKKYQYVCGYQLPCGEPTTCTCVPDFSTWYCNIDCAGGQPGCVVNSAEYSCPACASFSSTEECISNASKSR